ncbi:histone-lysine N-methyltransferase SETMAR-like protein [Plakobranchus ocellatus]|uniref:Histone-lysine N-methyltransferase SETMAR-like protein n=1 Tax=Plakobranchus ocellatus TaxID=259542 RepID=A0AAV4AGN1_9GAST|nr:histone-lysine N-methyltransferase SETMAR-like protein [Plakobranchus ocellatus]
MSAYRRVKQKEIADEVGISKERVHHIVTTVLGYRKVSARWVPRQLTVEMKVQRKDMCTQHLERYNAEGEAFLQRILTGDKSWVHHYDPECKAQSMEYRQKTSPSPRKFKKYLKGHHYDNGEEVIAHVRRWCRGQSSKFFADSVRQLVKRWRLCVDRGGDYIEK